MDDKVKENAKEIAELFKEVDTKLSGTNICTSSDIYFFKILDKIANLSNYTVGIVKEMNNSTIHRGTYNIYLMCEKDAYEEIMQYVEGKIDEN